MKINHSTLFFVLLLVSVLIFSCKDSKNDSEDEFKEGSTESIVYSKALIDEKDPALWIYDYDADIPMKNWEIKNLNIAPKEWIDYLNAQNQKVYLEYSKHSGDTLYVKINESTFLTQQMGSAGADAYLSVATYTLTEAENVNYVHFDFEEGDHAIPGIYSRQYYIDRNKKRFH